MQAHLLGFHNCHELQTHQPDCQLSSWHTAFIGFDNDPSCEEAYFKMNNVLIDDRRIKVDFSQSVAHLWKQFKK